MTIVRAKINFEENLGSHKNVYFRFGEGDFCVNISANTISDKEMNFSINPKDLYFFDIETKEPIVKKNEEFYETFYSRSGWDVSLHQRNLQGWACLF